MSFSADIAKFAIKSKLTLGMTSRAIKLSLFKGVILDTRVKTGRLRGNWQTSTGQPIYAQIDRLDKTGEAAIAEAAERVTAFGVNYMTNNMPYAQVFEEKDGMIAKNLMRIDRTVKEVAQSVE